MNKEDIIANLDAPGELEKLYRSNKQVFKKEFNLLFPGISNNKLAEYWNERLNFESSDISWGSRKEMIFVIIASLVAGCVAKLPAIFNIDPEYFYQRNIGFIIFPILSTYFIWKMKIPVKKIALTIGAFLFAAIFINLIPVKNTNDTMILSNIHLPIFLWGILGYTYAGENIRNAENRLNFLRYNGDLVIITTLLLIAGGILSGITIGLFSVIGFSIEHFYFNYIAIFGLSASPVVGTYIIQTNPQLVNKISPVIAKIFSPLVLIMLVIYLAAIILSGKDPYKDRDFLMLFNFLLIGVMAIILFSVAESSRNKVQQAGNFILTALSIVTIIVNGIALSAILFRISEWGITPNRLAVLGGNILILINLCIVTFQLAKNFSVKDNSSGVNKSIANFLPVYIAWTIIVTFIFPFIFHIK